MIEQGKCPICGNYHDCEPLTNEEATMVGVAYEPGPDEGHVYYRMSEHINPTTGEQCVGTDKTPKSLAVQDEFPDDFFDQDEEDWHGRLEEDS